MRERGGDREKPLRLALHSSEHNMEGRKRERTIEREKQRENRRYTEKPLKFNLSSCKYKMRRGRKRKKERKGGKEQRRTKEKGYRKIKEIQGEHGIGRDVE